MVHYKVKILVYKIESIIFKEPMIVLENEDDKRFMYTNINDFIVEHYAQKAFNTKRNEAIKLQSFLNYVFFDESNNEKVRCISQLKIKDGENFINFLTLTKKLSYESIQKYINTLNSFYIWLAKYDLLKKPIGALKENSIYIKGKDIKYFENLFKYAILPSKFNDNPKLIHEIEKEYIGLFLKIAIDESEIIAFGIYMQFFGGLRVGDVVSLKKDDIRPSSSKQGYYVRIKEDMDNDKKDGSSYVKKERNAYIFPVIGLSSKLYMKHLEINKNNFSPYLFNNKKGKKLTGVMYRYYFSNVKKKFIYYLKNSQELKDRFYGRFLEDCKWSTHIGRGIFTNMLSSYTTPSQLAYLRGDSSDDSALIYIETSERELERISQNINQMYLKKDRNSII